MRLYEYSALVTDLDDELVTIMRYYRNRADCRRNQKPMGLGWLCHAASANQPNHGTYGGLNLQRVEPVCSLGHTRQTP
jgi:hypothetical protein